MEAPSTSEARAVSTPESTTTEATSDDMSGPLLGAVLAKAAPLSAPIVFRVYVIRHGETSWNLRGKIQGGGYDVPLNDTGREQGKKAARVLRDIPFDAVVSSALSRAKETADIIWEEHRGGGNVATKKEPLRIVDAGFNEMRFGEFEGFGYRKRVHGQEETTNAKEEIDPERVKVLEAILEKFLAEKKKVMKDPDYCFPSRVGSTSATVDAEDEVYQVSDDFGKGESHNLVTERTMGGLSRVFDTVMKEQQEGGETTATTTKHIGIVSHGRTNKVLLSLMMDGEVQKGYKKVEQSNVSINVLDFSPEDGADRMPSSWKGVWTPGLLNYVDHIKV